MQPKFERQVRPNCSRSQINRQKSVDVLSTINNDEPLHECYYDHFIRAAEWSPALITRFDLREM